MPSGPSCVRYDLRLVTRQVTAIDHEATGRLMREAREEAGIWVQEMARRLGCSASYVVDLENGRRNWTEKIIEQWAHALTRKEPV